MNDQSEQFKSFKAFYPYYLAEHNNVTCRRLHFIGSTLVLLILFVALLQKQYMLLLLLPVVGYGFAWIGHFFFEKNKPATFKYPLYSFLGDWVMFWQILTGKIKF
ncbi:DUF962 domain-containing protein [Marinicella sp. S1101]|uniref:DUF962 domain-containing protein n=1 Tax=Marinicella marina TaxID=2996016 RepID=UPI002260CEBB|nr:DUF962 domain-containing protein [Marinicella marina]MCX7552980.1 DUF962 domain-containing protein [Marinicella marina]MDJ1139710.1 DUF962 domain-containing protein [Marinicella marina]